MTKGNIDYFRDNNGKEEQYEYDEKGAVVGCIDTNLGKTVAGMLNNDYKERFVAEYQQVFIRYTWLLKMVEKWDKGTLDFNPTCPRSVYDKQLSSMKDYIEVLKQRATMEGIELSE